MRIWWCLIDMVCDRLMLMLLNVFCDSCSILCKPKMPNVCIPRCSQNLTSQLTSTFLWSRLSDSAPQCGLMRVSSQRPSAVKTVPSPEVHAWTMCDTRNCGYVKECPIHAIFAWMTDVTWETRPGNSQLDLNEWQYPHLHLFVWVCVCVWESDTSQRTGQWTFLGAASRTVLL